MTRLFRAVSAALAALVVAACYSGSPAHASPAASAAPGPAAAQFVAIAPPSQAGHFETTKFDLRVLMDRKACGAGSKPGDRCLVQSNGHSYYALGLPVTFVRDDGRRLTAPAGMTTDLASIPQVVWSLLPPDGPWAYGAAIHDDCYRTHGSFVWVWAHAPSSQGKSFVGLAQGPPLTRADCDETFRQTMVALKVAGWKRVIIYEAVRVGGGHGWGT